MKFLKFLTTLPADAEKYLGTTTAKVVPLAMGLTGTIGSIDPTPITSAITRVLPLLHLTPHATHLVGTALTGVAVVHALFSKSPETPAKAAPVSPGADTVAPTVAEKAPAQAAETSVIASHIFQVSPPAVVLSAPAKAGTTSSSSTSGILVSAKTAAPAKENPVSNMPQGIVPTEPTAVPTWLNQAETIGADIQSSLPVLNEVLAMVTALTGKSIPGLATGETVALAILADVNSFAAGKAATTPTVTFTVAGVKMTASLTVQKA